MKKPRKTPDNAAELRRRAEKRLQTRKTPPTLLHADQDLQRLVHELQVHQVELEMQNEELRQARGEVEAGLRRYTDLYDFAPVGYFTLGSDGAIRQVNLTGARLLGVDRSRLIGASFGQFVSEDDRPAFDALLGRVFAHQTKEVGEVTLSNVRLERSRRKEPGQALQVRIEAAAAEDGQACLAAVMDISDRRLAEEERKMLLDAERAARGEAERANRLKDEFLATVSHELRTPLTIIVGWSKLLWQERAGDPRHALDVIRRSASSLAQIVEDLLDVSRIVSGKIPLNRSVLDIGPLVRQAIDGIRMTAEDKGILINASIPSDLPLMLCDPNRVQQMVWNLLTNAVKFTDFGGQVSVVVAANHDRVEVVVRDTGRGISAEFLPHVFEHFQQADASTTRQHGGLGLGLSVVKHLVELHGGTIRAESAGQNKGAAFTISLPAATDRELRSDKPIDADLLRGMTLLILDDDCNTCAFVGRVLIAAGAHVHSARSAEEGLGLLNTLKPDVVISDISMPGLGGYGFIRRVRSRKGRWSRLPCIALTALARQTDREKALEAGYDEHLAKPFDPMVLTELVATLAARARGGKQDTTAPEASEAAAPAHVLLVEDSADLAELLRMSLEAHGYRVSVTGSLGGAMDIAERSRIDLLLTDLRLPDGTGWELLAKLKAARPVPGIMMSGYSDGAYVDQSKAAGFSEFLSKPVDEKKLLEAVSRVLKQSTQAPTPTR